MNLRNVGFIGKESYSSEEAFDASMMVHFRKRIGMELINQIHKEMVKKFKVGASEKKESKGKELLEALLEATCTPADVKYPTDIEILNKSREKAEKIIDELYKQIKGKEKKKPRTYRLMARKDYLEIVKNCHASEKETRKGIKKQLQYLKRNLSHIEKMVEEGAKLEKLTKKEQEQLITIKKVYEQQLEMYKKRRMKRIRQKTEL
jgi:IS5 family transposase